MGYRQSDLQPAFNVPGTHEFTVWGYGTTDTLEEILRPNYMHGNRSILRPGDLIYVRTRPRRDPLHGQEDGETRSAVVMVCGWGERGYARLRLAQDFGRPEDGATPQVPAGAAIAARPAVPAEVAIATAKPAAAAPTKPAAEPPARGAGRIPGRRSGRA